MFAVWDNACWLNELDTEPDFALNVGKDVHSMDEINAACEKSEQQFDSHAVGNRTPAVEIKAMEVFKEIMYQWGGNLKKWSQLSISQNQLM